MVVAAIMLAITFKLKQPMVIGYIAAGMIIGPYTPPFSLVRSPETLNLFAELGIIMLLFVTGTEFPIAKLRSVGRISIVTALAESIGTLLIVFFIAQNLGFSFYDSVFLALALSITSTVVTIRILEDVGLIRDKSSTLILGMLIVEDIVAISVLGVMQSFVTAGGNLSIANIAITLGIVGGFIGGVTIIGSKFVPRVIDRAGRTNDYALLLITILGLAFGLSFLANGLGMSVVIGAFLAGVLVAESKSAAVARIITIPLRDMFAALFFISIGALMDVSLIPTYIVSAIILILTSFASKFLIVTGILVRGGYDNTTALRSGLGIAATKGELSLVIGKGGQDVGAISSSVLPMLGVVTIVTSFIGPFIIRVGSRFKLSEPTEEVDSKKEKEKEES
ncbi:monovalent cation/proton antiporter-2 family protein [Candidatus Nitrososphaera gargensis Ga9.2]|uniref:Monovalent cation/proton antiporter-2 family protein n=2 Tax=Candidatus Nitrososphaera gargensis TaxID=497727 RepID=K0IMQ9_NITGG|nr:monovalent cation/proton antiporter-2 family protein [Candidatus Nitrososphaera gargensis Ga9.2]